jgi:hypothetical protein
MNKVGSFIIGKKGQIVFVLGGNPKDSTIYGCNLESRNLRIRSYHPAETSETNIQKALKKVQPDAYYNLEEQNKYHLPWVTKKRLEEIKKAVGITIKPFISESEADGTGYHLEKK